ncbi:MAG TPA: amino acid adenylation domain-containing protein [Lysobacter sp.]|nr:amino acid adenylation domain-containing protein [Lysobacter sp.]
MEQTGLLDVLPLRAIPADDELRRQRFFLSADDSLGAALRECSVTAGDVLVAALALVESRLTGADGVLATRITGADISQCVVDPASRDRVAAVHAPSGHGPSEPAPTPLAATPPRAVAWAVLDDDTQPAALQDWTTSIWQLRAGSPPSIEVSYRPSLADDVVNMLGTRVQLAITSWIAGDEAPDLLDPDERQRQLVDWNRTTRSRPPYPTVQGLFAAMRDASPSAVAVVDGDTSLTYAQLDRQSREVARRLRAQGVHPGDVVAVAMERSAAAIVAVLGVLKAGAAYLPLDLKHPAERLEFMLKDARATVVLVGDADASALPGSVQRIVVDATQTDGGESGSAAEPDDAIGDGESLAYVMYTSGSTGQPKGVEIRHCSILRLVCGVDYIELDPQTRFLHAAPLGFDASTLEIWGALLNGGCVVVHGETTPTGAGLATCIAAHDVTTAWLTAALFNAVVDEDPRQLAGLRQLLTGGEALSVAHVRRMLAAAPGTRLHNGYGPTECTTFTCTWEIPADFPADAGNVPIGRPIANTRVYVLNARREPVPVGVIGELYVGGEGLARGYLNQPGLTGERFVPDPFGAPGERLYRTGDQVRYRPDGIIEFVGRVDTQVKIRGFRIELAEIEAALASHPSIRACAVLACADPAGDKRLVAYCVAAGNGFSEPALRAYLAAKLPEFMLPARYVRMDALPVTENGKLDRRALPAPDRSRPELACAYEPPVDEAERRICQAFSELLDIDQVGRHDNFFELGGNSLLGLRLLERIRPAGSAAGIPATALFHSPTAATLAKAIQGRDGPAIDPARLAHRVRHTGRDGADDPIAIVGMAGRFPGAADVEAFWQNLCEGRDSITVFGLDGLDPAVSEADRANPLYVPARGVIDEVEQFDAGFFGISPRQAELMDPQQRIFLELCWECLERAGHVPDASVGPVGVFAGMYNATYFQRHVAAHPELVDRVGAFQVMLDNEKDYIATRVAHKLNLTGPAVSVHTGCSTSLVAICQAVDSLRGGQCDMALAGGIAVTCPPRSGYPYQEGAMLSPDGHTRTFDVQAQGTVFSDGGAVVLLKRLSDARADGNPIYAVIRGRAVNNDGGDKASFTAPSMQGQAAVVSMALDDAGVEARTIGYVETHGTATPLGDPIEIEGLATAFRRTTSDIGFCRIGSLKSNVGHMVTGAGAAGVIKAALSLSRQCIPASIHFSRPNPAIDFAASPFVVNAALHDWPAGELPRRAGVSSFGVGGTNAHVVLEEAPPPVPSEPASGPQLLVLSARTPAALGRAAGLLADHLDADPDANLADVAWTLAVGRKGFAHRVSIVAADTPAAVAALRSPEVAASAARSRPARAGGVVFLFPGQGATYPGMGRGLYDAEPAFRAAFDACNEVLGDSLGFDLRERVFSDDPQALLPTSVMQPATFAVEYALAKWWMSLGIVPAAMVGHSVGEFVAATLAGVFTLADGLHLVARRGALMQAQPTGAMLSVRLSLEQLQPRLSGGLSLAAENAPGACVVAGTHEAIAAFQARLDSEGVACRLLETSHAFHSEMMEPVVEPFRAELAGMALSAPTIPLVSTATGTWLGADAATSVEYWARHLLEPVRFAAALGQVIDHEPARVLLEVGPRASLSRLSRQHPDVQKSQVASIASLDATPDAEVASVRQAAGQLWSRGVALDPAVFDRRSLRHRLRLPTYPFERKRHWVEALAAPRAISLSVVAPGTALESVMLNPTSSPGVAPPAAGSDAQTGNSARRQRLAAQVNDVVEDVAGFDLADADASTNFIELGLDSLMLTQVALQLQKTFQVKVTFRQLMGECSSLEGLVAMLDAQLPADELPPVPMPVVPPATVSAPAPAPAPAATVAMAGPAMQASMATSSDGGEFARQVIAQQMQLMGQQLALLSGVGVAAPASVALASPPAAVAPEAAPAPAPAPGVAVAASATTTTDGADEEAALAHTTYDVKKAFGAIARIDNNARFQLTGRQREKLDAFIDRYVTRTHKSKAYTRQHRPHMADPRVVNGFRPLLKEIIYQIVIERSKGAHLQDLDGNDYVDALNGFGMSLFGWQPDFVLDAVRAQLELGYEIGPQHPLAGEVAQLACEVTGHDRAALCNTGSEAVLGALRIARTVTGRETVVLFTGSYHGIIDEMIVRGTKKLRAVPAAPGILRNTAEHVMVLDYGTPESLEIIRAHAGEIAAVLVEPVQSRRPDFQPVEFLRELRTLTRESGALLVFDEVVTGFRAHPAGIQGLFGIPADLATYGKVVGGGFPIGLIAGKREYMDALDGGQWQFGDDSVPTVGVTYFAGTFVRHPLALAAAKAVLTHIQQQGPQLQERLNARVAAMVDELNAFCADAGAPVAIKYFASVWKTQFLEDHPLQDLLFAMMRSRGIHILDNFPCFLTTAHSEADFQRIVQAFKDSIVELQEAGFLPRHLVTPRTAMDASRPPVPDARIGRGPDGCPGWYVPNPDAPGKFLKVG